MPSPNNPTDVPELNPSTIEEHLHAGQKRATELLQQALQEHHSKMEGAKRLGEQIASHVMGQTREPFVIFAGTLTNKEVGVMASEVVGFSSAHTQTDGDVCCLFLRSGATVHVKGGAQDVLGRLGLWLRSSGAMPSTLEGKRSV